MVTGYEVSEDGTLQEVEMSKDDLDSTKVVCIVDDETKSIYLWKGTQAGIRKKFIGARVATNLRTEYGFHFKVRPLDEGEEPPTFFSAIEGTTAATKVMKPGDAPPPPRPPTPKTAPPSESTSTTVSSPVESEQKTTTPPPKPKITPPPTTTTSPPKPPISAARPATTAAASPRASSAEIDGMIKELEAEDPPEGYQREHLIIYNELYTVAEHKLSVFGQEKVERRFEKVRDPPEGTFMAEGFIPRVIVKDGRVLGIELLKGTPDAILSPIKTEMKERLGDLISFFKSEVEEEDKDIPDKKTSKKGKKLVAK